LQDVFDHIDANRELYLERLKRLLRAPGVAAEKFGMQEAFETAAELAREVGANVEEVKTSGQPVLWADFGGTGRHTVNLYNHYDVQPADPLELWDSPPFEPTLRDGALYARGIGDDKGPLVGRICAIEAFREVRGELPVRLRMAAEGEEEIGSVHLEEFVDKFEDRLREADACIWEQGIIDLEGRAVQELGVKGILYIEARIRGPVRDTHSAWGGVVPNPAWKLVRLLSELVTPDGRVSIPGFYDDVEPPSDEALRLAEVLVADEPAQLAHHGISRWNHGLSGKEWVREYLFAPTANIAGFHSGYGGPGAKTIVPAEAFFKVDFRLVPRQDPNQLEQSLRAWLKERGYGDVEVEAIGNEFPSRADVDHPLVQAMVKATEMVGLEARILPTSAGTGPMYPLCDRLGLPCVNGETMTRETGNYHAPNEHVFVDDYIRAIKQFAALLDVYAQT
jgi:acetylornithine deacetylase/succinyl-diaminopimelate desuccinylase-like protein